MAETGRVRFGIFDFDPSTRELRREGIPVRLQSQPAHVLAILIAQAGEIVSRDALRQAVWGAETFVDFDRGLNFCIAQIRAALGDSAESPRFVKTLPKRGYQFIAPVGQTTPAAHVSKPIWRLGVAAGLVAAAAAIAIAMWPSAKAQAVRVAVARFDNQTDSPEFDRFTDGLTDAVVAELTLANSGRFGVIGNAAILRQPRAKRDLLAIGSALKVSYIILGGVQRDTSGVHVLAHLIHLPEQTHVTVSRIDAANSDAMGSQGDMARRIVQKFSPRMNLPAAASYSRRRTWFLTYSLLRFDNEQAPFNLR